MRYSHTIRGVFLRRPNRFIAEVLVEGEPVTVHVKNTGRCRELLIPGVVVILERASNPNRKTPYDLIAVYKGSAPEDWDGTWYDPYALEGPSASASAEPAATPSDSAPAEPVATPPDSAPAKPVAAPPGMLINMDSQAPNKVVGEWLAHQGFSLVKPEYTFGNSRVDFYMERAAGVLGVASVANAGEGSSSPEVCAGASLASLASAQPYLLEVKGCTLEIDGVGYFPDAPTERGVKHLRELAAAVSEGYRCALAFAIQMPGITKVLPNIQTHPEFGEALAEAQAAGVQVLYLPCTVREDELYIDPDISWDKAVAL